MEIRKVVGASSYKISFKIWSKVLQLLYEWEFGFGKHGF